MKNKVEEFKAVEFMRNARKQLTEKYQKDKKAFLKELDSATLNFIELRKNKKKTA